MPADELTFTRILSVATRPDRQLLFIDYRPPGSSIAENHVLDLRDYLDYWRGVWHRESTEDHQSRQPQPLSPRVLTGGGEDG